MRATVKSNPRFSKLAPYVPGKPIEEVRRELGLKDVIKLASNENPLGSSPRALAAAVASLRQANRYPEGSSPELRQALARAWNLTGDRFVFGNGSNEILMLAAQAYCGPGDEVVYSARSFAVYRMAAVVSGASPVEIPSPDFTHDLNALALAARGARMVFVCNPNNPTGSWHGPKAMERFLRQVPSRCLVVLDEAYAEYCGHGFRQDKAWLRRFPNLLVCRTFSKIYGLAGFRVGYGVAGPDIVQALEKVRQPFNVNRLAQAAAAAALGDEAFARRTLALNARGLAALREFFLKQGIWFMPSRTNFVFFMEPPAPGTRGKKWVDFLLSRGVIVRPMEPGYLRVTTGTMAENERFMEAMREGMGV